MPHDKTAEKLNEFVSEQLKDAIAARKIRKLRKETSKCKPINTPSGPPKK